MSSTIPRSFFSLAAVAAAGVFSATSVSADHLGDIAQFLNGFGAGDGLWSNPDNWNNHGPPDSSPTPPHHAFLNVGGQIAIVDINNATAASVYAGQGGGDGGLIIPNAGSLITSGTLHIARDSDRNGSLLVEAGGYLQLGALSGAGTSSGSILEVGHQGSTATAAITGGTIYAGGVNVANSGVAAGSPAADGSLTITGGTLNALHIGIGQNNAISSGGVGHLILDGDATVNTANHIFLRSNGRGNLTINGSNVTTTLNRVGATGFEVTAGSVVNFNADPGGFSTVTIPASTMRFSGIGDLNINTDGLENGIYDLFTFNSYFAGDEESSTNRFNENITGLAAGQTGEMIYNPQSIQLSVIPEPGTCAALVLGLGLLMSRRRRA